VVYTRSVASGTSAATDQGKRGDSAGNVPLEAEYPVSGSVNGGKKGE
jgi:hypothetical protein